MLLLMNFLGLSLRMIAPYSLVSSNGWSIQSESQIFSEIYCSVSRDDGCLSSDSSYGLSEKRTTLLSCDWSLSGAL
jgi:hypothetical protein